MTHKMRTYRFQELLGKAAVALLFSWTVTAPSAQETGSFPVVAVGAQYDTTHVYVDPNDFDHLVSSFIAAFGGHSSKQGVFTVTPVPSSTMSQLALTPVGTISVFGFETPVPYPFGEERTGYLVKNLDVAVSSARAAGAEVLVAPFNDPVGRDVIIQWPGGVKMQLYWHTTAPAYDALQTVPENRVYVSQDRADEFVSDFSRFAQGRVIEDNKRAPGVEIGRPGETYRRIRIESGFGKVTVLVTDGHLPYPYGHEMTGYQVSALDQTLASATKAGARILSGPYISDHRNIAIVQFPGGYIAEVHDIASQ